MCYASLVLNLLGQIGITNTLMSRLPMQLLAIFAAVQITGVFDTLLRAPGLSSPGFEQLKHIKYRSHCLSDHTLIM